MENGDFKKGNFRSQFAVLFVCLSAILNRP